MLKDFLIQERENIERRSREVFLARSVPTPTTSELERGIPIFIEQLVETLGRAEKGGSDGEIGRVATDYGKRLFQLGFTVSEVVHGYGSLCEVVTKLAGELGVEIEIGSFEVFNRTLDVAIAEAVTEHERQHSVQVTQKEVERIGVLAHELRGALATASLSFDIIRQGTVGVRGRTADVLDRNLARMADLIDRSLAEVRLRTDPAPVRERVRLVEALDQIGVTMRTGTQSRGVKLVVEVDPELEVETDRQFLVSAVSNLLQNALAYTRANSRVLVRAQRQNDRLLVEVEDECGGLPPGKVEELFRPFVRGTNQSPGVGLGLSIARRSIQAIGGEIRVRNLPGHGCIFIADLPAVLPAAQPVALPTPLPAAPPVAPPPVLPAAMPAELATGQYSPTGQRGSLANR